MSDEHSEEEKAPPVRVPELLYKAIDFLFDVEERIGQPLDPATLRLVPRRACATLNGNRKRADLEVALCDHAELMKYLAKCTGERGAAT